jgi:hypothetical protein
MSVTGRRQAGNDTSITASLVARQRNCAAGTIARRVD